MNGYNTDLDGSNETYTTGLKEVYYLDAIRTRTHTALFCKKHHSRWKGVRTKEGNVGSIALNGTMGTCTGVKL